jgi:hypothetical protein
MDGQFLVVNVTYEDFLGQFIGGLTYTARVVVCLDGVFGSVCDVDWDQDDATVFCRSDFGLDGDYGEYSLKLLQLLNAWRFMVFQIHACTYVCRIFGIVQFGYVCISLSTQLICYHLLLLVSTCQSLLCHSV